MVTLAYAMFRDEVLGRVDTPNTAYVGYAICMPEDQHCKAKGRQIAEGRMRKLDSRMEIPLGNTHRRQKRLELIINFLAEPSNTVDQYGGRLLSETAEAHREWENFGAKLIAIDLETVDLMSPAFRGFNIPELAKN